MSEDQNYPIYQCITIDSASSSDLDDAFSIRKNNEGWTVRCCIADISTIDVGSNLERSARQNVHTVIPVQIF
ncbi:RNB domain-containing ribonuclease [Acetobacter pasteurianus]|uniref:RNB domain-containing ribonuclease n=1 Tax=Acetobacter pasteurianus TaxID=438 RepID=UPI000F57359E